MIIGIGGNLSGGKTITAVKFAYDEYIKSRKPVMANINLNFPYDHITNSDFISFLKINFENILQIQKKFANRTLILDEITNLLDARRSGADLNSLITNFMMMVGKLDCDVIFTYQILQSQVDVRLREICNVFCRCCRVNEKKNPIIFEKRIMNQNILIWVVMEINLDMYGTKIAQFYYNPKPYYKLFDTREVVLLDRSKYTKK